MDVKRLDFPDRELFILADGDWRGFRSNACAKEPETVEWLRRVAPGSVVWDVGASVGPYSLVAAALGAKKVVAFEPYGPSYGHLCQNVSINGMGDVIRAFPIALRDVDGFGWDILYASSCEPGAASHSFENQERYFPLPVMHCSAYDAPVTRPAHVKIDVDGGEVDVIASGRQLWSQAQSILIEASAKTIEDIAVILGACGLEQTGKWERSGGMFNYLWERTGD